jgi:hypothetical protein
MNELILYVFFNYIFIGYVGQVMVFTPVHLSGIFFEQV